MESRIALKKEDGITLVALIITVILLLILAGVAISSLINDGGLFGKAKNAAIAYKDSSQVEKNIIDTLLEKLNGNLGDEVNFPSTESSSTPICPNFVPVDARSTGAPMALSIRLSGIML